MSCVNTINYNVDISNIYQTISVSLIYIKFLVSRFAQNLKLL